MSKDFELKKRKEFHQSETLKVESHYQTLSTTNREEPEQFMNASRKQTESVLLKPKVYINIAQLSQEKDTEKDAADVIPAVSSHRRAMDILKTYIKAEPATKNLKNAGGSDTESDTSDLPASSPQQVGRNNTCISTHHASIEMKSSGPYLKSDVSTQPAMHSVSLRQSRSHPDTAPGDGDLQSLSSSSKKESRNKYLLLLLVVCCVLVAFLVFTLLLTFAGLNRSELMKNQAEDSHSTATSNMLIINLTKQVRGLEESLNQMKMDTNTAIESLNAQSNILTVNFTKEVRDLEESLSQMITQSTVSLNENLSRSSQQIRRDLSASINSHVVRLGNEDNNLLSNITSHVRTTTATTTTLSSRIASNYREVSSLQIDVNTNRNSINSQRTRLSRLSSCVPPC